MTDHDRAVVLAMGQLGGSFASALAEAFWRADDVNFATLKRAFPDIWAQYVEVARLKAARAAAVGGTK